MFSVTLSGVKFHAPIGAYKEEQILGNEIEINITLSRASSPTEAPFLDYESIFEILNREVNKPEKLLENLLERIRLALKKAFPQTNQKIEIRKWYPPFKGQVNFAAVSWED